MGSIAAMENPPMTRPPITGDQRFVKSINRNVLLRLLLDEPGQSRAALAERSGLTKSTVSLLTKELLDEGWLDEDRVAVTGSLGRRPTPLRIVGHGLALIGAELGTDSIRVAAVSLHGEVLTTRMPSVPSSAPISARPRPAMRSGVGRRPSEPVTATPSSASQPSSSNSLVSRLTVDLVNPLRSASVARDCAGSSSNRRSSTLRLIDLTNRWSPVIGGGLAMQGSPECARALRRCATWPPRQLYDNESLVGRAVHRIGENK